jgi:hypothetical protein
MGKGVRESENCVCTCGCTSCHCPILDSEKPIRTGSGTSLAPLNLVQYSVMRETWPLTWGGVDFRGGVVHQVGNGQGRCNEVQRCWHRLCLQSARASSSPSILFAPRLSAAGRCRRWRPRSPPPSADFMGRAFSAGWMRAGQLYSHIIRPHSLAKPHHRNNSNRPPAP